MVHEYLKLFVFQHKMISYEYFMDRLADYELTTLLDCIDYAYVEEWQQTRILLWSIIKTKAGKKWNKQPKDLIPLVVDKGYNKNADELDEEEQNKIRNIFKAFRQKQSLNSNGQE